MADTSQGEGWWLAADGKWYSPETTPGTGAASLSAFQTGSSTTPTPVVTSRAPAPSAGQQNNPGGFVSFIGWLVVVAGVAVILATLVELSSSDNEFLELNFADYLIALSPGFTVLGIGAAAAALGGIHGHIARS